MRTTPPPAIDCTALSALDPLHSQDVGFAEVYRLNCTSIIAPWDGAWQEWLAKPPPPRENGLISP